jgi:hypothetical protein
MAEMRLVEPLSLNHDHIIALIRVVKNAKRLTQLLNLLKRKLTSLSVPSDKEKVSTYVDNLTLTRVMLVHCSIVAL